MKANAVQTCFVVLSLVVAAALQDMAPQFAGVKPPLLATLAIAGVAAAWLSQAARISLVVGAGCMADALGELPPGAMGLFIIGAAAAVTAVRRSFLDEPAGGVFGLLSLAIVSPLIEVWLYLWGSPGSEGAILSRMLAAMVVGSPIGALAFASVEPLGIKLGLSADLEKEAR